jgi:hypothetical protein
MALTSLQQFRSSVSKAYSPGSCDAQPYKFLNKCQKKSSLFLATLPARKIRWLGKGFQSLNHPAIHHPLTCVNSLLTTGCDYSMEKMSKFSLFFSGHIALEKIKAAFQTERQNCLCMQFARFRIR